MTIAALIVFASLLASWLAVPSERRRHVSRMSQPIGEALAPVAEAA